MLCIVGEIARNERAHRLTDRFLNVMSDITNNIDPQEISAPIQRGLSALRKLGTGENRTSQVVDGIGERCGTPLAMTLLNFNAASIVTPADSDTSPAEDHSPYSVLNAILWGNSERQYT